MADLKLIKHADIQNVFSEWSNELAEGPIQIGGDSKTWMSVIKARESKETEATKDTGDAEDSEDTEGTEDAEGAEDTGETQLPLGKLSDAKLMVQSLVENGPSEAWWRVETFLNTGIRIEAIEGRFTGNFRIHAFEFLTLDQEPLLFRGTGSTFQTLTGIERLDHATEEEITLRHYLTDFEGTRLSDPKPFAQVNFGVGSTRQFLLQDVQLRVPGPGSYRLAFTLADDSETLLEVPFTAKIDEPGSSRQAPSS